MVVLVLKLTTTPSSLNTHLYFYKVGWSNEPIFINDFMCDYHFTSRFFVLLQHFTPHKFTC